MTTPTPDEIRARHEQVIACGLMATTQTVRETGSVACGWTRYAMIHQPENEGRNIKGLIGHAFGSPRPTGKCTCGSLYPCDALCALAVRDAEVGALVEALTAFRCPECGGDGWTVETRTGSRAEHHPSCDGNCRSLCPVEVPYPIEEQVGCAVCQGVGAIADEATLRAAMDLLANLAPAATERDQRIAEEAVAKARVEERERIRLLFNRWREGEIESLDYIFDDAYFPIPGASR